MNSETTLFRQINQSWTQGPRVTSQAFTPTAKDEERISTYDGDQITAEKAWKHFTRSLGYQSEGVVGVTVEECLSTGLSLFPDPGAFQEHVLIDFQGLTRKEKKDRAKILTVMANKRDWLFKP